MFVTCAACGAKVRGDRSRCLRCGETLVSAVVVQERHSAALTKYLVGAGVLAAAGLAGMVATRPAVSPPAAVQTVPSLAPTPVSPEQQAAREPARPAPGAVPVSSREAVAPGLVAYASGDMATAADQFRRAVELDPDDSEALNNLGQVLVRTGRAREAIAYFDRAIALVPENWAYRFNRARAYAQLEQWGQAIAGYREAVALFPDDYATHFNLAKALQKSGDLDEAIAEYERAIALAPGEPDFHLSHGLALEAARRPKDAAEAYKRYLELAEGTPEADKVKGRIALLEGTPARSR